MTDAPVYVDPESHRPLRAADEAELAALSGLCEAGVIRRRDGGALPERIDGAYLADDAQCAYAVVAGVANFLVDERLEWRGPLVRDSEPT